MANDYGLFFRRDDQLIRLPVNPEKLPVARSLSSEEYNVLGLGQIIVPRAQDLRKVTISSFFPGRVFPGVLTSGGFQPPEFYIAFFEAAMADQVPILYTPVRYYEDGEQFMAGDLGFSVLVTQFDTEERGGETGDFYYTLELTEYRDYAPQTIQLPAPSAPVQTAKTEPVRAVPNGQLCVGSVCVANGPWYYSSYGDEPHGNGNGRRVVVSRIVDETRKCPVHVVTERGGALGWMSRESLRVENGAAPVKVAQSSAASSGASGSGKKAQTTTISRETLALKEKQLDPGTPGRSAETTAAIFAPTQAFRKDSYINQSVLKTTAVKKSVIQAIDFAQAALKGNKRGGGSFGGGFGGGGK